VRTFAGGTAAGEVTVPIGIPASLAMLAAAGFEDTPHGSFGELLPVPGNDLATRSSSPLEIPPPDWEAEERERLERGEPDAGALPHAGAEPLHGAVEAMMAAALEAGEIPERRAPGPPERSTPLARFVPPAPDWRQEARELAEREAREAEQPRGWLTKAAP
jgi:hypothetical protein